MIIFMGVAGSGKSSQGRRLADEYALPWLSTGEFLRMLIAGPKRRQMQAGKLLSDSEIIGLIRKVLAVINTEEEFVLDGFPRTTAQADWLLSQAKHGQLDITAVIHLTADQAVVEKRLLKRGRQDDTEGAISERFNEYEAQVKPIIAHFKEAGVKVFDINADQPVNAVYEAVDQALKSLQVK